MKARAAISESAGMTLLFDDIDVPAPGPGEVGVKIVATGLCHTDITGMQGAIGLFPTVFGHEGAGIVEAVGPDVTEFKVGDRVATTYSSCGCCEACRSGQTPTCDMFLPLNFVGESKLRHKGQTIYNWFGQNSFSTHTLTRVRNLVKVPDGIDLATTGPYGCGMITGAGAMFDMAPGENDTALIFGLGAVGFAALMAAKIAGCKNIIAVSGTEWKNELALELGATHIVNRRETPDIAAEVRKIAPRGANVIAECTGRTAMATEAQKCVAANGKISFVAVYTEDIPLNYALMSKNVSAKVIMEGAWDNRKGVETLMKYNLEGKFPVEKLITYYDFEDIGKALDDLEHQRVIKAVLKMPEE